MQTTTADTRPDSKWSNLSEDQLLQIEQWLFDEHLSQAKVHKLAAKQFKFPGSLSSFQRLAEHLRERRLNRDFLDSARYTATTADAKPTAHELQQAAVKIASQQLLLLMVANPTEPKKWLPLGNWIAKMARIASNERLKDRDILMRQYEAAFAREKFDFTMLEQAYDALPELKKIEESFQDPELKELEHHKKLNDLRFKVFGVVPYPLPETPEEKVEWLYRTFQVDPPPDWRPNPELLKARITPEDLETMRRMYPDWERRLEIYHGPVDPEAIPPCLRKKPTTAPAPGTPSAASVPAAPPTPDNPTPDAIPPA